MKKLFLAVALMFAIFPSSVKAQTRVLVGPIGGINFNNLNAGISAGIEVPFVKRFEIDLQDNFYPFEEHVGLGKGRANQFMLGGNLWVTKSFGFDGKAEYSNYDVTSASKGLDYAFGGLIFREVLWGAPTRLHFDYVQEFKNGIMANGTETSHLKGAAFTFDTRIGCSGPFCYRISEQFSVGHVLTQGNPMCDGTFGLTGGPNGGPCYRQGAFGGGFTGAVRLEFPRHKDRENEAF